MDPSQLVLRDVHLPASPSWWPPAPGWWIVAAIVLVLIAVPLIVSLRRRRRMRRWARWFDQEVAGTSGAEQIAMISGLLRRAARRIDPKADRLQGDAWLRFLDGDGDGTGVFSEGDGRVLLEGAFRRDVDDASLARLRAVARPRFLQLMGRAR